MFEELAFSSVKDKIKLLKVRSNSIDGTLPKSGKSTRKLNANITPSLKPAYLHLNAVSSKCEGSNVQDRIKFFVSSRQAKSSCANIKFAAVSRKNLSQHNPNLTRNLRKCG